MSDELRELRELFGDEPEDESYFPSEVVERWKGFEKDAITDFSPGDVVTQRKGYRQYRYPTRGCPGVFVKWTETIDRSDSDAVRIADCVVGVIRDGEYIEYRLDSRLLERF